jgi:meso-butanediol dehydrogenase / (S,S)-butanediol dehydrogenase / diacetyl reductase
MADRFHGKVVIVTGAASGIGEATARRFVSEDAKVAQEPACGPSHGSGC